jgi:hypothetical protein
MVTQSVAEIIRKQVVLEVEGIDRIVDPVFRTVI